MNAYRIESENDKERRIILELQLILPFQILETGIPVQIKKEGKGISISKENGRCRITYEKSHELARAWFLMLRSDESENVVEQEQCSFEEFQVMIDCSRNAVMKPDTVKQYIRYLAVLGYSSLQLYTEDTMKVEGEPYVGYMRGAYTKGEIQTMDDYCKLFGMELIPCIQTLAHINQITRYEKYREIIDVNDILLAGEERTYEFLEHVIASVADAFSSRKINIGMDEAHMLGLGKYLDQHGYQERYQIMIRHLKKIMELLQKYGFQPMMWSDMFFRLLAKGAYELKEYEIDEELFSQIPEGVQLLYWDYYSMDYEHYDRNLKIHKYMGKNVGFAGGAWKWTGFAPENGYSLQAGDAAIKACRDNEVKNFIVTCWGDNGAEASAFSVLPCLYQYAEAAYRQCSMIPDYGGKIEDHYRLLTGLTMSEFMVVDTPNQIFHKEEHTHTNPCKYLLYNDVLYGTFDSVVTEDILYEYTKKAELLNKIARKKSPFSYIFYTLSSLCRVLSIKAGLGNELYQAYQKRDRVNLEQIAKEVIPELLNCIEQFEQEFWYQWQRENKSFGFEIQLIRLGGVKERLIYTKEVILMWLEGGIDQIEELEEERLPYAYSNETSGDKVNYNLWNTIVSPGVIG